MKGAVLLLVAAVLVGSACADDAAQNEAPPSHEVATAESRSQHIAAAFSALKKASTNFLSQELSVQRTDASLFTLLDSITINVLVFFVILLVSQAVLSYQCHSPWGVTAPHICDEDTVFWARLMFDRSSPEHEFDANKVFAAFSDS